MHLKLMLLWPCADSINCRLCSKIWSRLFFYTWEFSGMYRQIKYQQIILCFCTLRQYMSL